ncbi:hypothetical protein H4K35_06525 [Myroides sp. NP-2]|nr:lantibiotic dehydratase C-terminal domain-containing protein [Myroides sp. NP-2]MBB1149789.1 hypothetical protein [Myroides sp. NP-2]
MKYRKYKIQIVDFLNDEIVFSDYSNYFNIIDENNNTFLSNHKQDIKDLNMSERKKLIFSFIHMHINRIISANQRMHELVLYGLLADYYKMKIALTKYNP